jgi:hypothetical protein
VKANTTTLTQITMIIELIKHLGLIENSNNMTSSLMIFTKNLIYSLIMIIIINNKDNTIMKWNIKIFQLIKIDTIRTKWFIAKIDFGTNQTEDNNTKDKAYSHEHFLVIHSKMLSNLHMNKKA